jgi:peptidoglycan/LPS O-acetylase OafA/YrhL
MQYRKEIDGLRALAVLPVILFHAGFESFSGGFVGVDIFFVISGYLITSIILGEKDSGHFSILNFYERRMRRILPALFFVMAVCVPFAWFWLLPEDLLSFSKSLVAVSTFSSNFLFWQETGYFDGAAELKPLLHTWSLAVEEQYYVLFPLFIILAWRFGKKTMVGLLVLIAIVSLTLAHWGAYNKPTPTFFLLPTRGWELIMGALIAFYLNSRRRGGQTPGSALLQNMASFAGMVMILVAITLYDASVPFPSLYALLPVLGAVLIILFATPDTVAGKLLSTRAFVGIGLISYSAYLWHQPILAYARHISEPEPAMYLILILLTLTLAFISYRFVEQPFRKKGVIGRSAVMIFALSGTLLFITIGMIGYLGKGFEDRRVIDVPLTGKNLKPASGMKWENITASRDKPKILVYGDSHAKQLVPSLKFEMEENGAYEVNWLGNPACLSFGGYYNPYTKDDRVNCRALYPRLIELLDENVRYLVVAQRWQKGILDPEGNYIGSLSEDASVRKIIFDQLTILAGKLPTNTKLVLVGNVPGSGIKGGYPNCAHKAGSREAKAKLCPKSFEQSRGEMYVFNQILSDFAKGLDNVIYINPYETLCPGGICTVVVGDKLYYADEAHLTRWSADQLVESIVKVLENHD